MNHQHLFLIVLDAEKSKVKVLTDMTHFLTDSCFLSITSHGGRD